MEKLVLDRPVGQLVVEKPARSRVFERWGIDHCCGGKKSLSAVCAAKNLDPRVIMRELQTSDAEPDQDEMDWQSASLSALCDHIEAVHHGYLRDNLPRLTALTERVADRHGERDPRLFELRDSFREFRAEVEEHTAKEDRHLFPAIRGVEAADGTNRFGRSISVPIQVMLQEHSQAHAFLQKFRSLTDDYEPVPNACNTHRAMLDGLAELERDMHQHVHKENNILFPRAIKAASTGV